MSLNGRGGVLRLTPRNRLPPSNPNPKASSDDDRLQLTLKTVIGTTTNTPNAFDSIEDRHVFAHCAGPAAIICEVDEDINITQRLFRARPNASPVNSTASFYNPSTPPATPTRSRRASPFKQSGYTNGAGPLESAYVADSPSNSKVRNSVREATCLSLSRQGNYLAVGETGHNPRVLVFSTAPEAPTDVPLAILTDHTFGIQSVAFSPDSRWLCSLGNSHDAFLLLYSVNANTGSARLHSSNKCSNVENMIWIGDSILTFGTRHAKIWRTEKAASPTKARLVNDKDSISVGSPGPKTLAGRNCILGPMIDATFTAAAALSHEEAILVTSTGDICLLDDSSSAPHLEKIDSLPFSAQCAYFDGNTSLIWFGGADGQIKALHVDSLVQREHPEPPRQDGIHAVSGCPVIALGAVRNRLVTVDRDHAIGFTKSEDGSKLANQSSDCKRLPAHESAVLGSCSLTHWSDNEGADFLTYSARGTVLFWNLNGGCCGKLELALEQPQDGLLLDPNEIKVIIADDEERTLISGDKRGALSLFNRSGESLAIVQAHNGDINGIASVKSERHHLVSTCGRDRTVQVFEKSAQHLQVNLIQTLEDHAASVTDVKFIQDGAQMVSISADRSILLRNVAYDEKGSIAYLPFRSITLKASPVSLALVPFDPDILLVSTMDRQIQKYALSSGRQLQSFKALDPSTNDSVLATSLQVANIKVSEDQVTVISAVSSTDKSIRLHDYETGTLIAREHGQMAVSAVNLLQRRVDDHDVNDIVSCGLDGTVIIYNVNLHSSRQRETPPPDSPVRAESPLKQSSTPIQPLRKTLTKSEIAEFQKSFESSSGNTISPIRSPSPARIKKKPSRYTLGNPPRASILNTPTISSQRKTSQDHSPTPSSPKNNTLKASRPRARPSLDHRHRSKSVANLNDLNLSAEHLCDSLRTFRNRIASSVADKLNPDTMKELRGELDLTLNALDQTIGNAEEKHETRQRSLEPLTGDLLDAYLAKMIDERLALKAQTAERSNAGDRDGGTSGSENVQAGAGAGICGDGSS